jgi:hypothetical protein
MEWRCKCRWIELDDHPGWVEWLPEPYLVKHLELLFREEEGGQPPPAPRLARQRSPEPAPRAIVHLAARVARAASPQSPPATPSRIGRASREGSAAAGVAMEPANCTVPHLAVRVARDPSAYAVLPLGTCVSSAPLPPGSCPVRLRRRQSQDLRLETKGNEMDMNGE